MEQIRKNIIDYLPFLVNRTWRSSMLIEYKLLSYELIPVAYQSSYTIKLKFEGGVTAHCDSRAIIYTPVLRPMNEITKEEIIECSKIDGTFKLNSEDPKAFVRGWVSFKPEVTKYLLNQGIDLFGLIELGLAIKSN